jgi:hypothetical protein
MSSSAWIGPEAPGSEDRSCTDENRRLRRVQFDLALPAACGPIRLVTRSLCCKLDVLHVVVGLGPETPLLYMPRLTSDQ